MKVCILQMLYYDRIDVSERIDVNKKVHQKSVMFVTIRFHDLLMMPMNFSDIAKLKTFKMFRNFKY